MALGVLLAIVTLMASIGLLSLSGWFLAGSALAGVAGLYSFNYMLPAAGVRGAAITRTAGRWAERVVSHDATFRVLQHLRIDTFNKILPLSPGVIAGFRQADLLNRLVADVDTLDHLYLRVISPLLSALLVILSVTIGLCWLDVRLALTLGAMMLTVLVVFPPLFYHAGKPIGKELTGLRAVYRQQLAAWLQGNAELTVYGAARRYRYQLDETERRWQLQQQRQANLSALSQALLTLITGLAVTILLWLAADGFGGNAQPGALIALLVFTTLASFEALGPVAGAFQHLGQVMASASRITDILSREPAVIFPASGPSRENNATLAAENLQFTYPGQAQPALNGVSLRLEPGEHVAIVGHTGSGKSTLLQLLTRAWDPDAGQILLNGKPLSHFDESTLRAMMSIVPQRVHIFSATLRDNLLLGAPSANDDQLRAVLSQTGLAKLLAMNGLDSWLGEGGRQLSGGEQRRLGIARALLQDAPLMLLDEPTEGLDAATEQNILALLRDLGAGKTMITVTHRLQGLEHMDGIYVMNQGRFSEQGGYQALMEKQGRFFHFHDAQEV
jgi:ATP-binding cassette subfamily C protein CydC